MTDSKQIIVALEEQVDCYRRLAKLAKQQHDHVRQNQTELLLNVLRSRQTVLEQIARLEAIVSVAKKSWPEFVGTVPADRRAKAQSLFAETRALLEEITQSDRNDVMVLQQRKLNLGREMKQASAARAVNKTYVAAAYGSTRSKMDVSR